MHFLYISIMKYDLLFYMGKFPIGSCCSYLMACNYLNICMDWHFNAAAKLMQNTEKHNIIELRPCHSLQEP